MSKFLRGRCWFTGFTDEERLILAKAIPRVKFVDGKPTDLIEAVRLTALMQNGEEINIDLRPFSKEKSDRCRECFGMRFSISDLVGIEDCRIFVYQNNLHVTVSASDLSPLIDL